MTLSQQSARLGLVSVQLELSLRLRLVLKDDPEKARDFARAIVAAWEETRVETSKRVEMSSLAQTSSLVYCQTWLVCPLVCTVGTRAPFASRTQTSAGPVREP